MPLFHPNTLRPHPSMANTSPHDDAIAQVDEKHHDRTEFAEEAKVDVEVIVDRDAAGYVDHTIVIDDATNRRLRRLIHWR